MVDKIFVSMDAEMGRNVFALQRENISLTCRISDQIFTAHKKKNMGNKVRNMDNKINLVISMLRIEMERRFDKKVFALTRENFSIFLDLRNVKSKFLYAAYHKLNA